MTTFREVMRKLMHNKIQKFQFHQRDKRFNCFTRIICRDMNLLRLYAQSYLNLCRMLLIRFIRSDATRRITFPHNCAASDEEGEEGNMCAMLLVARSYFICDSRRLGVRGFEYNCQVYEKLATVVFATKSRRSISGKLQPMKSTVNRA